MKPSASALAPFLVLLSPGLAAARAPQDDASSGRPAWSFLRQNEDWSAFTAEDPPEDPFDPIKHVKLTDDGDVWVSFGGRVEARFEAWRDFGFGPPPGENFDDNFVVSRILLHADLHVGERLRAFVEGKSAQATDRDLPGGRRPLDMDTLDLQQGFVDFVVPFDAGTLRLRPGRQMLSFGAQRLVSPLPWGNTLRTWDGVTAEWRSGAWSVTGLATAYVPVDKTEYNSPDDDITLFGVYATRAPQPGGHGLDLYALGNERPEVAVNGTAGDEERQTFGARGWGPLSARTDYEVEGAWQIGEVGDEDVEAWFLAAQTGWKPEGWAGAPRLWVGLDAASGDDDPGGGVGTFHQLFPLGHAYFGAIDAIGRQNILGASAGSKWIVDDATSVSVAGHAFRLMSADDALYDAGGAATRTGFDSRDVGFEVDLLVDRKLGRHSAAYAGYSHFFAGEAIEETGPDEDIDFFYLGLRTTF